MKKLKLSHKIVLFNIGAAILFSIVAPILDGSYEEIGFVFGVICLLIGILDLGVGIILSIVQVKEWNGGFLISAGILLLLSGISCGGATFFL